MDNDVVKSQMLSKANAADIKIPSATGVVTKTQYESDRQGIEKNINDFDKTTLNISGLVEKTDYNTKLKILKTAFYHWLSDYYWPQFKSCRYWKQNTGSY